MGKSIENKQLLLHFIFKKLVLKEGNVGYELNPPFCYMESSVSSDRSNNGQNSKSCKPEETQGFEGNFSPNLSLTKNTSANRKISLKNKRLDLKIQPPVQRGWGEFAIREL